VPRVLSEENEGAWPEDALEGLFGEGKAVDLARLHVLSLLHSAPHLTLQSGLTSLSPPWWFAPFLLGGCARLQAVVQHMCLHALAQGADAALLQGLYLFDPQHPLLRLVLFHQAFAQGRSARVPSLQGVRASADSSLPRTATLVGLAYLLLRESIACTALHSTGIGIAVG